MIRATIFLIAVVLSCVTHTAVAAQKDGRELRSDQKGEKERAAKKACLNGDTTKGVELLTDLYVDTNDAVYIYNQGRCYEQNNRCQEAIVRFREYLRKTPDASERDQRDVKKHIADCVALLAENRNEVAPPPTAASLPAPAAVPPVETPMVVAQPAPSEKAPPQGPRPGSGLRLAGMITMGVGGALLVAGGALNLKHDGMIRDLRNQYNGATDDSAQTYKALSIAGYTSGAACLLGGAVLYWLGYTKGHTVVAATRIGDTTGLLLAGAF